MTETVTRGEQVHEGKAKILYATSNPDLLIQYFTDNASAFNGLKKGTIGNKGACNNAISSHIFALLEKEGFRTHFVDRPSETEMLVKKVEIIPVEVVLRNVVAGSLSKRMGLDEGAPIKQTVLEYYYKDDDLGDPMINRSHISAFDLASVENMDIIEEQAYRINDWLVSFFDRLGITLVDYKLEFGISPEGVLLADEISPDGCRLWDKKTGEKMDKDRFRRDLGRLEEVYTEMRDRILSIS